MLRKPGDLTRDFLAGRTRGILDPIQYFITCTFVEMITFGVTHKLALALDRVSALNWLARIGSIVAIKILVVFWMGSVWYCLFKPVRYNLAEIYAFTIYAFGTIGVVLLALPVIDLLTPAPLAANPQFAMLVMGCIQAVYLSYAVHQFAQRSIWSAAWRVCVTLAAAYALPAWVFGTEAVIGLAAPSLGE